MASIGCGFIPSSEAPIAPYTTISTCLALCETRSAFTFGISVTSSTDSTLGCHCFDANPFINAPGTPSCTACPNDGNALCGNGNGNVKSLALYLAEVFVDLPTVPDLLPAPAPGPAPAPAPEPSRSTQPPAPSSSPAMPNPDQPSQPVARPSTDPQLTSAVNDIPIQPTMVDASNPAPSLVSTTQITVVTNTFTGTDGIATLRPETIIQVIFNTATIPITTSIAAQGIPSPSTPAGTSTSFINTALLVGGICAAVMAVIVVGALIVTRVNDKRKLLSEKIKPDIPDMEERQPPHKSTSRTPQTTPQTTSQTTPPPLSQSMFNIHPHHPAKSHHTNSPAKNGLFASTTYPSVSSRESYADDDDEESYDYSKEGREKEEAVVDVSNGMSVFPTKETVKEGRQWKRGMLEDAPPRYSRNGRW
ncbi:hypothetical protein BC829DRAFT_390646 [Chytridium lagenaria]|nr:hypothetical protein BC829DRAFT_390646 [Chytridium lagenaria]